MESIVQPGTSVTDTSLALNSVHPKLALGSRTVDDGVRVVIPCLCLLRGRVKGRIEGDKDGAVGFLGDVLESIHTVGPGTM
jgi:hypothetical protein